LLCVNVKRSKYLSFVDTLEEFVLSAQQEFLFFEEFELLSESMIRFKGVADMQPFDTTAGYTLEDEQLIINNPGAFFIEFDEQMDEIRICNDVRIALRGPNPPVTGNEYGILLGSCDFDFDGHLGDIIDRRVYVAGDTVALYVVHTRYR
jgi:hypothetical protein